MKLVAIILYAAALVACGTAELETRITKLEQTVDRYQGALTYLQQVYDTQLQQQAAQRQPKPEEADPNAVFAVDISQNLAAGFVEGPATGAPVTIIKAWDFACPYCERVSAPLEELVKEYNGKVRVVFKNMVVHPQVMNAHLAGCAAAKQGKFQPFKAMFWDKGFKAQKMDDSNIEAIAKEVGINIAKFNADKVSGECRALIESDMNELRKFKVTATPAFFVNGNFVGGSLPKEQFKQMIEERLKTSSGPDHYNKEIMTKGDRQFRAKA